jgi:IS30 family transposase
VVNSEVVEVGTGEFCVKSAELLGTKAARPVATLGAGAAYLRLYVQTRGALRRELTKCLRTGRALRHPSRKPGQRKNRIPEMVNISQRPAEAEDRAVPGHWEGDLIIGKLNQSAVGTLVERSTGYTMLVQLPDGYKT